MSTGVTGLHDLMFTASISRENFFVGIPFNIDYDYTRIRSENVRSSIPGGVSESLLNLSAIHIRTDIYDLIKDHRHHFMLYHHKIYDEPWVDVYVDTDIDTFLLLKLSI